MGFAAREAETCCLCGISLGLHTCPSRSQILHIRNKREIYNLLMRRECGHGDQDRHRPQASRCAFGHTSVFAHMGLARPTTPMSHMIVPGEDFRRMRSKMDSPAAKKLLPVVGCCRALPAAHFGRAGQACMMPGGNWHFFGDHRGTSSGQDRLQRFPRNPLAPNRLGSSYAKDPSPDPKPCGLSVALHATGWQYPTAGLIPFRMGHSAPSASRITASMAQAATNHHDPWAHK